MKSGETSNLIEQWNIFELALEGPAGGNPFVEIAFSAEFRYKNRVLHPDGFYDGEGVYRVRFIPDTSGDWHYVTHSNHPQLDGLSGSFTCIEPNPENHGPVQVRDTSHFAYADGRPYNPFGTTCYAWNHQGDEMEEKTLKALASAPFNKIRMCVFPKYYDYNLDEPSRFPYEGDLDAGWDFSRFNPEFFQHLEGRIGDLQKLGIEADLILFHPYDHWGFSKMDAESDDLYLRYVVARLAAYRNIWWSLANEFDLMETKSMQDWDRFFRTIQERDPYQHLRSIHNANIFYDHGKSWVTHLSVQSHDTWDTNKWHEDYKKPVIVDEFGYEGNVEHGWGNLSAQELVHRAWDIVTRGGYATHGETYLHPDDILWWSRGGELHGKSSVRIAFLQELVEAAPDCGLERLPWGWKISGIGQENEYYLFYFGREQPGFYNLPLPEGVHFSIEIIDTWEMSITQVDGTFEGPTQVELPSKPYLAVRISKVLV